MSTVEEETEGSSERESGNENFERGILRNGRRYTNVFKRIYLKVTFYLRTLSPCVLYFSLYISTTESSTATSRQERF